MLSATCLYSKGLRNKNHLTLSLSLMPCWEQSLHHPKLPVHFPLPLHTLHSPFTSLFISTIPTSYKPLILSFWSFPSSCSLSPSFLFALLKVPHKKPLITGAPSSHLACISVVFFSNQLKPTVPITCLPLRPCPL